MWFFFFFFSFFPKKEEKVQFFSSKQLSDICVKIIGSTEGNSSAFFQVLYIHWKEKLLTLSKWWLSLIKTSSQNWMLRSISSFQKNEAKKGNTFWGVPYNRRKTKLWFWSIRPEELGGWCLNKWKELRDH